MITSPIFAGKRYAVLGLARSGQSAALALARRGVPTVAADRAADVETGRLAEAGVEVHPGNEEEGLPEGVELLIKSPGVPGESPLAAAARVRAIPIWSEVELGRAIRTHCGHAAPCECERRRLAGPRETDHECAARKPHG